MSYSKPLAYPSQKCVIKHMEVNSRFKLSHQSPSIRKIEKSTPLRIDSLTLKLDQCSVKINNILHTFRKEKLPKNMQLPQAFMCLMSKLFCGRRDPIQVKTLSIECKGSLQLPAGLCLKVSHLEILGSGVDKIADDLQPLLRGSKLQSITVNNDFNIHHPIFKTAHLLILKNPNKNLFRATAASNVMVKSTCQFLDLFDKIVELIRNWQSYGQKIGAIWNFSMRQEQFALLSLVQLRKLPGASYKGHEKFSESGRSIIIPIDNSAEVHAFVKKEQDDCNLNVIVRRRQF
ncbi:F-box C protein [Caenorhabditis elegans]|uniref:F-box C protein n=1 Tax=Caenorhabditis elegans TaxID=6239 RepID=O16767_CAEEL|nr:F-box C protein [Caenorhabditis elegans]CCD66381.1 F-box C protein [Caenorhabditis elegans]|eukprot:NP_493848.1 F-box C protein [Caenorhabditis elegans]